MDRYPIARERIVKNFGSITKFCLASKIPKASVVRVLNGKYGSGDTDDSRQRERIEEAMRRLKVPKNDLRNLWARIQEEGSSSIVSLNGRRVKITTVTIIEDLGGADAL
jgi:hypothetical protein